MDLSLSKLNNLMFNKTQSLDKNSENAKVSSALPKFADVPDTFELSTDKKIKTSNVPKISFGGLGKVKNEIIEKIINEVDKKIGGPHLSPGTGTGACLISSNQIAKKLKEEGIHAQVERLDDIGRSHAVVRTEDEIIDRTFGQFITPNGTLTRTKKKVEDNKVTDQLAKFGRAAIEQGDWEAYKEFMKV